MKKYILTIITSFFILSNAISQVPYWFEELLEEKVRNQPVRELLEQAKLKYDAGESFQSELAQIRQVIKTQKENAVLARTAEVEDEQDFGFGAEPYITINPYNPNHLVVSYMVQNTVGGAMQLDMPVHVSFDGGDTWTESSFSIYSSITAQGLYVLGGGDPLLSFDSDSVLHLTWVYLVSDDPQGIFTAEIGLYYAHSTNGGLDFIFSPDPAIHKVYGGELLQQDLIDRQWMDVDATGGQYEGNVYMSALYGGNSLAQPGQIMFTKTPGVNQFNNSPVTAVPAGTSTQTQFGNVRVGDDGTVHLACMLLDPQTAEGDVMYVNSSNGGASYSTPTQVAGLTTGLPANFLGQQTIPSKIHSRENSAISLAAEGSNVYIAWSDMANDDVRSYLVTSNDNGATWGMPREFGEELVGDHAYHLMPNISADSGGLSLTWYVVNRASLRSDYYFVESRDSGVTFSDMQVISASNTDFTGAANSQEDFYGDYNSSVRIGCTTYAVWGDGRLGEPHTYIAKISSCNNEAVPPVSIEHVPINASYSLGALYPNPVVTPSFSFELTSAKEDVLRVQLFDMNGKKVLPATQVTIQNESKRVEVNASSLSSGSYILRVENNSGAVTTRNIQVLR